MKTAIIIILALAALTAVLLAVGTVYMFRFAVVRRRAERCIWDDPELYRRVIDGAGKDWGAYTEPREWLYGAMRGDAAISDSITSHDGLRLACRILPREDARGIALCFHGYRSSPAFDFGGCAKDLYNMGFTLCMPDQRAHGASEGRHITFGALEKRDVFTWCDYLAKKYPDVPVILCGISMGASTVMMALENGAPENVRAVLADCGYTSPDAICRKVLAVDLKLPSFPIYSLTRLAIERLAGFSMTENDAVRALRGCNVPIMIAHGTEDKFVPHGMSLELRAAVRDRLVTFDAVGAAHGESYVVANEEYKEKLDELFRLSGI